MTCSLAGAPVLRGLLAVHQALLEEAQEELLLPAVVFGRAGGEFAPPVVRVAQAAQLAAHVVDVGKGPLGGMRAVLDGGVFRRQPEGVPAHGVQHVEALHALEAGHHVADGIVAHVPHVDVARRVGEHLQHVVLGLVGVVVAVEGAAFFPDALPFGFDGLGIVFHAAFGFHAAMVLVGWSLWTYPCGLVRVGFSGAACRAAGACSGRRWSGCRGGCRIWCLVCRFRGKRPPPPVKTEGANPSDRSLSGARLQVPIAHSRGDSGRLSAAGPPRPQRGLLPLGR